MKNISLFLCVVCYSLSDAKIFESFIESCHRDDPDMDACVFKHAQMAMPHLLMNGDRKYGIPKMNPLELDAITLETEGNMKLSLSKVKMYGLDTITLRKVRMDLAGKAFHFDFKAEKIMILGKYDLNGKILSIPMTGNGDCNMTAGNADIKFNLTYSLVERNGDTYMELEDNSIDIDCHRFHFQFDNLFNGNEELGKNINRLLNEEWKSLFVEFKPAVSRTVSEVAASILRRMFRRVPYDMIFK